MANGRNNRSGPRQHWVFRKPSYIFQNVNTIISIVGVAISIVLSIWALLLTYKFGESTEQINKLSDIAGKQQLQIDRLQSILAENKKQTGLSTQALLQLQFSNSKLADQAKLLGSQLLLLNDQQIKSNRLALITKRQGFNKLKVTLAQIGYLAYLGGVSNMGDLANQKLQVEQMKGLLESELNNSYLLERTKATSSWLEFYNRTLYVLKYISDPNSSWFVEKMINGKKQIVQRANQDVKDEFVKYLEESQKYFKDLQVELALQEVNFENVK